jgi:hypothetical protein
MERHDDFICQIRSRGTAIVLVCPKCKHRSEFNRATPPHIDICGFESHSCRCVQCASFLVGVIDPLDGALLVSLLKGPSEGGSLPEAGRESLVSPYRPSPQSVGANEL